MPAELQTIINNIDYYYNEIEDHIYGLRIGFNWLGNNFRDRDWDAAEDTCYLMRDYAKDMQEDMCKFILSLRWNMGRAFQYVNDNAAFDASELTMEALINTMLIAEPDEVNYFIGLVDAFRQSVWNKPFNQEFFAALARGFEQWE